MNEEGLHSPANGFLNTGVPALVATLWSISDKSSVGIMKDFYINLLRGQPKNNAMQQAKISYIESQVHMSLLHPGYWGGYYVMGNAEKLAIRSKYKGSLFAITLDIVLVFLYVIQKKIRTA